AVKEIVVTLSTFGGSTRIVNFEGARTNTACSKGESAWLLSRLPDPNGNPPCGCCSEISGIAVSHSPDKDKMIRDLGADEVVRDGKSLAAAGGADVILSTSNSTKSMVDGIQGLRPDGRLVTMGAEAEPLSISLMDLIAKRIRIIGSQQNGPE